MAVTLNRMNDDSNWILFNPMESNTLFNSPIDTQSNSRHEVLVYANCNFGSANFRKDSMMKVMKQLDEITALCKCDQFNIEQFPLTMIIISISISVELSVELSPRDACYTVWVIHKYPSVCAQKGALWVWAQHCSTLFNRALLGSTQCGQLSSIELTGPIIFHRYLFYYLISFNLVLVRLLWHQHLTL